MPAEDSMIHSTCSADHYSCGPKLEEREKYILFALYVHKFKYMIVFFLVAARRWMIAGEAKVVAGVEMGGT